MPDPASESLNLPEHLFWKFKSTHMGFPRRGFLYPTDLVFVSLGFPFGYPL
jgi:hypothetical protein